MKIHKEGHIIVFVSSLVLVIIYAFTLTVNEWWTYLVFLISLIVFFGILYFFRVPKRKYIADDQALFSPADGKVIRLEEKVEDEYFDKPMKHLSIFMSPLDVHLNRYPSDGKIVYYRYHPGKYLVAWHPKSSELNERLSQVLKLKDGQQYMLRQVAGAFARRIVCYSLPDQQVQQGDEMGFIKFGSRLDLYLPLHWEVKVKIGDTVKGGITCIARIADEPKAS